jgi:hypothetical protein
VSEPDIAGSPLRDATANRSPAPGEAAAAAPAFRLHPPQVALLALIALGLSIAALGVSAAALLHGAPSPDLTGAAGGGEPAAGTGPSASASVPVSSGPAVASGDTASGAGTASGTGAAAPSGTGTSSGTAVSDSPTYPGQKLTLSPGEGCSGARAVDLDEPAVGATDKTVDLRYRWSCTRGVPGTLTFSDTRLATVPGTEATPGECATAIRTAPVNTKVTPRQGLALCTVTNGAGGSGRPDRDRMALIVVDTVGADSSVVLTVTAWDIPT